MSFRETSFENALAVERRFGIEYPTIADTGPGVLALGRYAPRSPPSTYVLDTRGRVAAVISGAITSAGTLEDVVEEGARRQHGRPPSAPSQTARLEKAPTAMNKSRTRQHMGICFMD